jgi:hypothetical protein
MMSGGHRTGEGTSPTAVSPDRSIGTGSTRVRVYGEGVESSDSMAKRVSAAVGEARESVAGTANQATDKVADAYHTVVGAAGEAADILRGAAASVTDRVTGNGQEVYAQASDLGGQARQGVTWLMREQPLVLGAIGVALGAAVGALLPSTTAEDRLMGETRDAVADRVQTTAQQGYERLKDTAGKHADHAKTVVGQAADGEGGTGSALTNAAREVRQVARDAAHDLASDARGAMEGQPRHDDGAAPASASSSTRAGLV